MKFLSRVFLFRRRALLLLALSFLFGVAGRAESSLSVPVQANPWTAELAGKVPTVEYGAQSGELQELTYEGPPLRGQPTKVFAILGRPEGSAGKSAAYPAVVLVHGGGGKAFPEWVRHWTKRGYFALAMDTAGQGPDGKHRPEGGPDQSDGTKFRPFADADVPDMWTFHAVAAVVRGASVLLAQPEVDRNRLALTGISWGGYLTCLVSGLDQRFKASVPVYGCGFLGDNSVWKDNGLKKLSEENRRRWLLTFDPSRFIKDITFPILFLNGTNDFAYPMDSYRKTIELVPEKLRTVCVQVNLKHGHYWDFPEVDAFIDAAVSGKTPLARCGEVYLKGATAKAAVSSTLGIGRAELHFTTDSGAWQQRRWQTVAARYDDAGKFITAELPEARPLAFYLSVVDVHGLRTSTTHVELSLPASAPAPAVPAPKLEQDFYDWDRRHAGVLWHRDLIRPDVVMLGDSITHFWGGHPQEPSRNRGADSWQRLFAGRKVMNLGFGWDRTQNLLWRLDHGEIDGLTPSHIVLNIGTNNLAGTKNAAEASPEEIADGLRQIVRKLQFLAPDAKIVLMGVFPRGAKADDPIRKKVAAINAEYAKLAQEFPKLTFLDITEKLLSPDGSISKEMMPDALHPSAQGYQVWAEALGPLLR